jgi:hypothetical protein
MRIVAAVSGAALIALAACGPRDETAAPAAPAEAPAPAQASAPAAANGVSLTGQGLTVAGRTLAFGTAEAETIAAVSATQGGRAPTLGRNEECGAGPIDYADWGDGLQLAFQDGRFAGWWANDNATALRTPQGAAVGMTLAQARAALPGLQAQESTIGPEFAAGDYFGTLSGLTDDARVTALWAGVSCIFR